MFFINTISRRSFLETSLKSAAGIAGVAALTNVPPFLKRALAEGNIGLQGKKVLFIWLRGANDALNSVIPIQDAAYSNDANVRLDIRINPDGVTDYSAATGVCDVPTVSATQPVFSYANAIRIGNGFAALHPALRFLAPVYNAGDLALVHRVGYPKQSRSHFDSQNYWENGNPNNNLSKDGIFYRTIVESGLANTSPITGVTIQSSLPLIMRGSAAAMTNLTDPLRYDLLGVPNNTATGDKKATNALGQAQSYARVDRNYRDFLQLQYQNLNNTLQIFASIDFNEGATPTAGNYIPSTSVGNYYVDDTMTDGEGQPYYLFPTINQKNGGYVLHSNDTNKYVVPTSAYSFIKNLKAAALILNKTDAFVAGTEYGGFDTHATQGAATGAHANLNRQLGWAIYALRKYFKIYGRGGTAGDPNAKTSWDDVVIVTLSEFGRTTVENADNGTDHAEAGLMWVAGGTVQGLGKNGRTTGLIGCQGPETINGKNIGWVNGVYNNTTKLGTGTMFGISGRYLQRAVDFRSVLGEIIRKHLGATQNQLNRIIPGYANEAQEHLLAGGTVTAPIDAVNTTIAGEVGLL
jgi:uncharacterized protein (DUF1501 family)